MASMVSPKYSDNQAASPFSRKAARTKPLFPYPEGSVDQDSVEYHSNRFSTLNVLPASAAATDQTSTITTGQKRSHATSHSLVIKHEGFYDRQRREDINRQNKHLLNNMLRIEKDLHKIKKQFNEQKTEKSDFGTKAEPICTTFQKSMIRSHHHTTQNRR